MEFDQQQDVVYGYKDGMALVMDVYVPKKARNGVGVIWVAAGGWRAMLEWRRDAAKINPGGPTQSLASSLLAAGYIVFAVQHSAMPKYTIDELSPDMPRAVRFIRHHADRFDIDPQHIGIMGGSSGGHVSLMTAAAPPTPDTEAEDLVNRESSEVQAVVAYFPPTDLLNYGTEDTNINDFFSSYFVKEAQPPLLNAAFDFHRWDEEEQRFKSITDPAERVEYFRRNSPIEHLTAKMPPVLLFHGDRDEAVPIQQSERLVARMKELSVAHKLVVFRDLEHAWPDAPENGHKEFLAWFGHYLLGSDM